LIRIDLPIIDDIEELQELANNDKLGSYPKLIHSYLEFKLQYETYEQNSGDPFVITTVVVNDDKFKKTLINHFNQPPKGRLEFISSFRRKLSPLVCPMCGSLGNGTVDHYLPKDIYPEFSFFSKNLVPACNCNNLRGTITKGTAPAARVIHPYYDEFIDQRLYQVVFTGDYETPSISIEAIDTNHPHIDTLRFHLENVILNEATMGWMEKYWTTVTLRHHEVLMLVLPEENVCPNTLTGCITKFRNAKDEEYGTPNNWFSMFYTGLLNDTNRIQILAQNINESRSES
jgi:5-methylcytosine-specific restriction endonuclease McrA